MVNHKQTSFSVIIQKGHFHLPPNTGILIVERALTISSRKEIGRAQTLDGTRWASTDAIGAFPRHALREVIDTELSGTNLKGIRW